MSSAVELIRGTYAAFNEGTLEDWAAANLPPDFELVPLARALAPGGRLLGPEGLTQFFGDLEQVWESMRIEIDEVVDFGARVVMLGRIHNRGRGSGMDVEAMAAHLWTVENETPVRVELIGDRELALRRGREEANRGV